MLLPGVKDELERLVGLRHANLFTGPNSPDARDLRAGREAALYYEARYGPECARYDYDDFLGPYDSDEEADDYGSDF